MATPRKCPDVLMEHIHETRIDRDQEEMRRDLSKKIANEMRQALVTAIAKAQEEGISNHDIAAALREFHYKLKNERQNSLKQTGD